MILPEVIWTVIVTTLTFQVYRQPKGANGLLGEMQIPVRKLMPRQQDFSWKVMGSNPVKVYFYNHLAVEFVH